MQLVSIILPYYKKIDYIRKTLDSIDRQTYKNYELIIIYDDKDLTDFHILTKITKKNPKVKIIKNIKNIGAGYSRNIGIKNSHGEFIAFIDADDLWHKQKIGKQIAFMNNNDIDFSFSNYKKKFPNKIVEVKYKKKSIEYKDLLKSCVIGLSTVMIKKNIINYNLFPNLKTQEDFVAWLKITKKNYKAYNLNSTLVTWNFDKNSLSTNFLQKSFDAFKVYNKYQKFSFIKSFYSVIILSINSLKRKF